jgi:TatD DNase family protein
MSTQKGEWDIIAQYPNMVRSFGIHPFFANKHQPSDLDLLEKYVQKYRDSMIGEIGLDKVATGPNKQRYPMDEQMYYFSKQMEIAAKLKRPVSIHSVQTHGIMLDYFKQLDEKYRKLKVDCVPPNIMMHSFSGSQEIAKALLQLKGIGSRFYFSFSYVVNSRSLKLKQNIAVIPEDRILLESDVHSVLQVDEAMRLIIEFISSCKGWDIDTTIQKTTQNTLRFLNRI